MRWRSKRIVVVTLAVAVCAVVPGWTVETSAMAAGKPIALPNATGAVAYSQQLTASWGAGAPYTFKKIATSKRLPPGLSLTSTGLVSGTPMQVGTYPFTVRVKDKRGHVRSAAYSVSVSPGISLAISGYVGKQCSVAGPFQSGTMKVNPYAFGPVTSVKGSVQVPGSNGPSLVTLSLNTLGRSGSLGLGWLAVINTSNAQCSALNPVFSLGRPTRTGPAAASGSGWFLSTVNGVNYALSVQFTVVAPS